MDRGGKGSYWNFMPAGGLRVTLSGQMGDDSRPDEEREVRRVIKEYPS